MPESQPAAATTPCPLCGEPIVLAQSLGVGASRYIRAESVRCANCAGLVVATATVVGGEAQSETAIVPMAGGDSGGLDALLLG